MVKYSWSHAFDVRVGGTNEGGHERAHLAPMRVLLKNSTFRPAVLSLLARRRAILPAALAVLFSGFHPAGVGQILVDVLLFAREVALDGVLQLVILICGLGGTERHASLRVQGVI